MRIFLYVGKWYDNYAIEISKPKTKEVKKMSVRARILALRLLEKQKKKPDLFKQLGIEVTMQEKVKKE